MFTLCGRALDWDTACQNPWLIVTVDNAWLAEVKIQLFQLQMKEECG